MLIPLAQIVIGIALLIYGADTMIRGASSIAKKAGLSALFIGLTIVAFGTSLPELVVNIFASFGGSNDLAIGNILGSNISNILLIMGVAATIYPMTLHRGTVNKQIPFSLLAIIALFVLANDQIFSQFTGSELSRGDGIILLLFFVLFMYYTFGISKVTGPESEQNAKVPTYSHGVSLGMIVGGIVGLTLGGHWVVKGAVSIAQFFSVSEALIGLTIVAIGTSLPELATSAVAAVRRQSDIAIGNIVGSNIFNILWILGLSSVIRPLTFSPQLNSDVIMVMFATIILMLAVFVGKRNVLQRWQGSAMVSVYVVYIIYLVLRG